MTRMTEPAKTKRQQRVLKADQSLKDHARELLILLRLDEMAKKKIPAAPSEKVLDDLQQLAREQFAVYQGRIGKVPD
jgi:hypothetical protein